LCVSNKAIPEVQKKGFFHSFREQSAAKKRPLEAETNPKIYEHVEGMKARVLLVQAPKSLRLLKGSISTRGPSRKVVLDRDNLIFTMVADLVFRGWIPGCRFIILGSLSPTLLNTAKKKSKAIPVAGLGGL
jgi:hypothetical protein